MNKIVFSIHIVSLSAGIFCLIFSASLALLYFLEQRQLKNKTLTNRVFFPLSQVDRYATTLTWFGFSLLTVAIFTGIFLAHFYWEHHWYANPKLILSILVWFWYFSVLIFKRLKGLTGHKFLFTMAMGLLLIALIFVATYFWSSS